MIVKQIAGGELPTNCYILQDEATKKAAVVDPGFYSRELEDELRKVGIENVQYILLTHGHYDHVAGVGKVKALTGAQVVIYADDEPFLSNNSLNLGSMIVANPVAIPGADQTVQEGDTLLLGELMLTVLHTPGHTVGSCCFLTENALFSGDTLFQCSMGRTDFPTGSNRDMMASLKRLAALPGNFKVYPGHEGLTTLEYERTHNPYLEA